MWQRDLEKKSRWDFGRLRRAPALWCSGSLKWGRTAFSLRPSFHHMRPEKRIFTASTVCLMIWRCFPHHQGGAMCSTLTGKTSCFPCSGSIRCRFSTGMPGNLCLRSARRRRLRGNASWRGWSGWISPAAERMRSNTAFIKRSGRQGDGKLFYLPAV